jgi:3-hydroxyacyl-CoA dehydrogenase / enoyl-CoA hydratase / 3-hydroxybutyryl-CoA epimerase
MYIYKAAVVGAGAMGAEIAQVITFSGLPVLLKDIDQQAVDKGLARIRGIYERRVAKGKMSAEDLESKMNLVTGTTTYEGFGDVDIVIEAVPEQLPLKQQIFQDLDGACQASCIIATNTSSISISALGAFTQRPAKVVGVHFFYPAHIMKLIEVIPSLDTSQETIDDVTTFSASLRKLPVLVNECPGFLVNRLLMPYLNEAAYCLQEGVATAKEMDQALNAFGFPMGPCTLVDALGFDVCHDVVDILQEAFGDRMRPAHIWQAIYEKDRWGQKKGAGFYLYGKRAGQEDTEMADIIAAVQQHSSTPAGSTFSVERLLMPMINEAILCLQEHVSSPADVDVAMLAGLGFPQDKLGILHYTDTIGLDVVLNTLLELSKVHGQRFWPVPLLRRKVWAGHLGIKSKRGFFEYT